MSTRWLEHFFEPTNIAVIGGSERAFSMGGSVIQNLKASAFKGSIYAVNLRRYKSVYGVPCISNIGRLPRDINLAIICTPTHTVEKIIKQLGRHGIHAVMILTGGISRKRAAQYRPSKHPLRKLAREHNVRILGPDCLGLLVPDLNMNASYSHINALPGEVAYLGQSGTLASALLDWSYSRGIGFSHFLSVGNSSDVSMSDIIDYLSSKREVKAIMLHLEQIRDAPSFVRAVRNAAREKPLVAIKSSRFPQSQTLNEPLPRGLPHRDMIYEAMLLRAGVLRVDSTEELFESVESLTRMKPLKGERLAIVANGIGGAILAVDRLMYEGGQLAQLSKETVQRLSEVLPDYWSQSNPVDITPEVNAVVYKQVLGIIEQDAGVDAILVLFSPTSIVRGQDVANVVATHSKANKKNVLTSWMGGETVERSRHLFDDLGIPTYDTPDRAIKAFMHMVRHQKNQQLLRQTPSSLPWQVSVDQPACKELLKTAQLQGRDCLTAAEAYKLVSLYGFNVMASQFLSAGFDGKELEIKYPLAVKVIDEHYCRPFVYGGGASGYRPAIVTGIQDSAGLLLAVKELSSQVNSGLPSGEGHGFSVCPMLNDKVAVHVSIGVTRDHSFGPVILFGAGGAAASVMADRAVEFPPLNDALAHQLMSKTHVYQVLKERSQHFERDVAQLSHMLIGLSQMAATLPNLKGCELNVILYAGAGAVVVEAAADLGEEHQLCISPYPAELEERGLFKDALELVLRPVRAEDELALGRFLEGLSDESLRYRFFSTRRNFQHLELARFVQIDYQQEMAFVAENEQGLVLGVVRSWTDADQIQAEFSVLVADEAQGMGLGLKLMQKMIQYCKRQGALELMGSVLAGNSPMLKLADKLGFGVKCQLSGGVTEITLSLNTPSEEWQAQRLVSLHESKKILL